MRELDNYIENTLEELVSSEEFLSSMRHLFINGHSILKIDLTNNQLKVTDESSNYRLYEECVRHFDLDEEHEAPE